MHWVPFVTGVFTVWPQEPVSETGMDDLPAVSSQMVV